MSPIFGEYECKVDAKGRFLLPSALLKLLPDADQSDFVINRGLDPCLVLYPRRVWEAELVKILSLNQYVPENRAFARKFQAGAVAVEPDAQKRILVPRRLAEWAGLDKEVVLIGALNRIEVWSRERYDQWLDTESPSLESLAENVMGHTQPPSG